MISFADLMRARIRAVFVRHFRVAAIFVAAILTALFAFAFLLMAARSWLSQWFQSPIKADLAIGGALAFLAILALFIGEAIRRAPAPEIRSPIDFAVTVPVAAKVAPSLLNRKFLGLASLILGAVLIGREFGRK